MGITVHEMERDTKIVRSLEKIAKALERIADNSDAVRHIAERVVFDDMVRVWRG